MPEQSLVIEGLKLDYEGPFSAAELYKLIDEWLRERAYDKVEKASTEYVRPEGKYVELWLEPDKIVNDYVKYMIRLRLTMSALKEIEFERAPGRRERINSGKLSLVFDGILVTDWQAKWERRPFLFFLRVAADKFLYKMYTGRYEAAIKKDVADLHLAIKTFLNLFRPR